MDFNKVEPNLKTKIKTLKMKFEDAPQPSLLIPIPNSHPDINYEISVTSPEFTSLCPLAPTQPDYATITIKYRPNAFVIELKSLKLYLVSYRTVTIFHESVVGEILKDLVRVCKPKQMKVIGDFTVRGGIHTVIEAEL